MAKGFLRVKILINTRNPLAAGCWLARGGDRDSWVEFKYESLHDFCYKCGRIGHDVTECSFEIKNSDVAIYGDWTRTKMVRDFQEATLMQPVPLGDRRQAGISRASCITPTLMKGLHTHMDGSEESEPNGEGSHPL